MFFRSLLFTLFLGILAVPSLVLAQETTFSPLVPCDEGNETCLPGFDNESIELVSQSLKGDTVDPSPFLTRLINTIYSLVIVVAAGAAIVMIIIGGVQYVIARDNPSKKTSAKQTILNALIGLLIVLAAYAILNTINPKLLNFDFSLLKPDEVLPEPTTTAQLQIVSVSYNAINPDESFVYIRTGKIFRLGPDGTLVEVPATSRNFSARLVDPLTRNTLSVTNCQLNSASINSVDTAIYKCGIAGQPYVGVSTYHPTAQAHDVPGTPIVTGAPVSIYRGPTFYKEGGLYNTNGEEVGSSSNVPSVHLRGWYAGYADFSGLNEFIFHGPFPTYGACLATADASGALKSSGLNDDGNTKRYGCMQQTTGFGDCQTTVNAISRKGGTSMPGALQCGQTAW